MQDLTPLILAIPARASADTTTENAASTSL
ncbi:hypothetical protein SIN8267_01147 [Sinobacterium norvegicum]|uniref:Uncharacterized protein n=1 Tax=Sinobacterium norvegicum TaxID=1641715 RepID=A0ABN8ELS1_9GAMM|nr:hypothetical protein SIN8267_01147 [Sinobacterium norvegicum]